MNIITKQFERLKALAKGGFFYILSGNVLNKAIAMISSVVIARLVNKTEYAYLAYADNLYAYIGLLSGLGLSSSLLKYCGKNSSAQTNKAYVSYAITKGGIFELVVSLGLCVIASFVEIPYSAARPFIWSLCLYPALSYFYEVALCYLRTQYENRKYAIGGVVQSTVVCILGFILVLAISTFGLVLARYIAVLVVLIWFGIYILKSFQGAKAVRLTSEQKMSFSKMGTSL